MDKDETSVINCSIDIFLISHDNKGQHDSLIWIGGAVSSSDEKALVKVEASLEYHEQRIAFPWYQRLLEKYAGNTVIRMLLQLLPGGIGSAAEIALGHHLDSLREERIRAFFDTLEKEGNLLTAEDINSQEFVHRFLITASAAFRTRRRDKIRLLARLLINGSVGDRSVEDDDYDELLQIVDELSVREFEILLLLHSYEKVTPKEEDENWLQWSSKYWNEFLEKAAASFGLTKEEIKDSLSRLTRTGCYRIFTGAFVGYEGDQGFTTETFKRLESLLVQAGHQ